MVVQAAKDNISPMVMAMLTAQAADYYDLARALMIAVSLSSYVDAVRYLLGSYLATSAFTSPFISGLAPICPGQVRLFQSICQSQHRHCAAQQGSVWR
jgi:hypothetical protein